MNSSDNKQNILILEDDPEQMDLLVDFALSEVKTLVQDANTSDTHKQQLKNMRLIKVNNIASLEKAVSMHKRVVLALLDCNTPDTEKSIAHDQLIKTKHKITGQHKSVDIVTKHLPDTPITMISSLNRFQRIVKQYYENEHQLSINFISKNDHVMLKRNIGYYLRRHLRKMDILD